MKRRLQLPAVLPGLTVALMFALTLALTFTCNAARADGLIPPDVRLVPVVQFPGTTRLHRARLQHAPRGAA